MVSQTLSFWRVGLSCSLPTEPCGTADAGARMSLLVTVRPLILLFIAWFVIPALAQKQTRGQNFHLRRDLRLPYEAKMGLGPLGSQSFPAQGRVAGHPLAWPGLEKDLLVVQGKATGLWLGQASSFSSAVRVVEPSAHHPPLPAI